VALGIYGQSKEHAPRLLILDEPTSSLDAVIKTHILDLLMKLRSQYRPAYLVISHDLDMIRRLCGRINVLYRGMVVEQVPCSLLSKQGSVLHPYTEALCKGNYEMTRQVPDFGSERTGCPCWGWCAIKTGACLAKVPELRNVGNGHLRACCADEQVTPPKGP
jgi:peptide/nickel transport system ATP-binding protein